MKLLKEEKDYIEQEVEVYYNIMKVVNELHPIISYSYYANELYEAYEKHDLKTLSEISSWLKDDLDNIKNDAQKLNKLHTRLTELYKKL